MKISETWTCGCALVFKCWLAAITFLVPAAAQAQGWDPAPLRTPTPIPRDGLPPGRSAFLAWLDRNSATLTAPDAQRAREHLYAYISELAKRQGGRFPSPKDTAAFSLFRAAAGIGATGADRVARDMYAPREKVPPLIGIPGFELTLRPPLFQLASDDGAWAVCYPYYFMTAPGGRRRPSNGVLTELAILSTLFAPDRGQLGSSQATILLLAAPVADSAKHVTTWISQFGLRPTAPPPEDSSGTWYASEPADSMHRLAVVRRLPKRVLVIAYLGLGGTFESNRPHFFNLLATIKPGHCAP